MNHQINIDKAIAIAKEYHLEVVLVLIFNLKQLKYELRRYQIVQRCV